MQDLFNKIGGNLSTLLGIRMMMIIIKRGRVILDQYNHQDGHIWMQLVKYAASMLGMICQIEISFLS